jgi:hypothetical protein
MSGKKVWMPNILPKLQQKAKLTNLSVALLGTEKENMHQSVITKYMTDGLS